MRNTECLKPGITQTDDQQHRRLEAGKHQQKERGETTLNGCFGSLCSWPIRAPAWLPPAPWLCDWPVGAGLQGATGE